MNAAVSSTEDASVRKQWEPIMETAGWYFHSAPRWRCQLFNRLCHILMPTSISDHRGLANIDTFIWGVCWRELFVLRCCSWCLCRQGECLFAALGLEARFGLRVCVCVLLILFRVSLIVMCDRLQRKCQSTVPQIDRQRAPAYTPFIQWSSIEGT